MKSFRATADSARAVVLLSAFVLLALAQGGQRAFAFGFDNVAHSAEQLAAAAYKKPGDTKINEITEQGVNEIKFDPGLFDYGANKVEPAKMAGLGFAGFRVNFSLRGPRSIALR